MDLKQYKESSDYIKNIFPKDLSIGVMLGSGLGKSLEQIKEKTIIRYSDIPHFPVPRVSGHAGELVITKIGSNNVAFFSGRFHPYEGHPMERVVYPIRLLKFLGIKILITTNAAGAINANYRPGHLVCIEDHINLMGTNPLLGPNQEELGVRFPSMTTAYSPKLKSQLKDVAEKLDIPLKSGVYCSVLGPCYETPSEIKMMRLLGADMVGMSTVPEVIAANHLSLDVLGISCITNLAADLNDGQLLHEDVKIEANKAAETFSRLLFGMIEAI